MIRRLRRTIALAGDVVARLHRIQEALGRIEMRQTVGATHINAAEFRTFSQWGEDGIIQYLVRATGIGNKTFIEFGVQDYTEANTRFLLINDHWSGLVIDGAPENIERIKADPIYWQCNVKAECHFITRDNINELLLKSGMSGEIGLLSIDIDGNDYWVWKAITVVNPAIVVTEYNARFGKERALTIPYDPSFIRSAAHHSNIYYGASLKAFCMLADEKGYALVGCNSAGNNAFFVRRDLLLSPLRQLSVDEGYNSNQFREARDVHGKLAFLTTAEERLLLDTLPLVDLEAAARVRVQS